MTNQTDNLAVLSTVVVLPTKCGRRVLSRCCLSCSTPCSPASNPSHLSQLLFYHVGVFHRIKRTRFDTSPNSWIPVFDVFYNRQEGQDWLPGWNSVEAANALANTRHAAGSVGPSPLPSPSPPTPTIYSLDQWTAALLDSNRHPDLYANHYIGTPNSGPSPNCGFPDSELSSCYSTPPSSIPSPVGDDISLLLTSPDQSLRGSYSLFPPSATSGLDLVTPVQPLQHSISPPHNNPSVLPRNFIPHPAFMEMTALGLYFPDTNLSLDLSPLPNQVEKSAPAPSMSESFSHPIPPSPVKWTFRAVDPSPKALQSKRGRSDKTELDADDATASDDASDDADVETFIRCKECGYVQSKRRMGDFRRHLKKHDAEHLTRVICCGVPSTHPAIASLRPGHLTHWYDSHPFYGGCGKSYSRMDALQRHLKKSRCVGGSTKDHQSWRKLYFSNETRCPH